VVRTGTGALPLAWLAVALALVLVLAGCDSSQSDSTAKTSSKNAASKKSPSAGDADMVAAFSAASGKAGQPGLVDVKFKLDQHPVAGQPVDIELALTPAVDLEQLFARFQAADGLQIVSGAETDHFEHPTMGQPVKHKITVMAKTDGIFYVTAVVLADSNTDSVARTFSLPLIAGQGLTEAPATPAEANVADPKRAASRP
jgi:hypothetical protein